MPVFPMGWDPVVLRKYNTTGHFRLINQLRSELKGNPLIRPKDGETVGAANRSRSLTRALQNRLSPGAGFQRGRRASAGVPVTVLPAAAAARPAAVAPAPVAPDPAAAAPVVISAVRACSGGEAAAETAQARSFRERLNAIQMR